jgi:cbb3-type cytochrome oxidase subunit 1
MLQYGFIWPRFVTVAVYIFSIACQYRYRPMKSSVYAGVQDALVQWW